jgi:hypothetical protein
VLRVSEGTVRVRADMGDGALRAHITELTFTRARLVELMRRFPAEFPNVDKDPETEAQEMRARIALDISGNDILSAETADAPPRSARISLSFTAPRPEAAWTITHALVDLLIDTTLARRRASLLRQQAATEATVEHAEERSEETSTLQREAVWARLRDADQSAASARLAARAAEQGQSLRFELVDAGRVPAVAGRGAVLIDFAVMFGIALLAACALAGAFDPRVLGDADLRALGVPLLGALPPLPAPPTSRTAPEGPAAGAA